MSSSILRLFAAIYPSDEAVRGMQGLLAARLPTEPHRLTPAGQVHMTLQFIGETPARELDSVAESVRRAASGVSCFDLVPLRLRTYPSKGPPRLIAVQTDAPGQLLEIQRRLVQRLARRPRADSGFEPHLTLLRFSGGALPAAIDEHVDLPPFTARAVVLVKSVLRADGARHLPIEVVELHPR